MQCTNCGFQNMPGSNVCGRCSTSLGLATAVMDVNPPRAGAMAKRFRRVLPVGKAYYQACDAIHAEAIGAQVRDARASLPPLALFIRFIVPGWAHFFLKLRVRGHLFLWGFVAFLLPTILYFGSTWGSIWLGMAFSVHSSAILDIVTRTFADAGVRDRIGRSIIISVVLWLGLYWPVLHLVGLVAEPHTVMGNVAPFRPGDVILVNSWEKPKRGDVVLFQASYLPEMRELHGHVYYGFAGENIDRILAVGGDRVQCKAGQLLINGLPSLWQPLNPSHLPYQLNLTVPINQYLLLPSGVPGLEDLQDANLWQSTFEVSRQNIVGRVYLQCSPLSRVHFIR